MWLLDVQDLGELDADLTTALTLKNGNPVYALSEVERAAIHAVYALYEAMLGQPDPGLRPAALDAVRQFMHDAYSQVQMAVGWRTCARAFWLQRRPARIAGSAR